MLPAEVIVEFIDSDAVDRSGSKTYEKGEVRSDRNLGAVNVDVVRTVLARVTMGREDAKALANQILWTAISNSRKSTIQLPPSYAHLQQGDIAQVNIGDGTKDLLLQRVLIGQNYLIIADGMFEEAQTLI